MGTGWSLGDLCSSSMNIESPNSFEFDNDGFDFLISYSNQIQNLGVKTKICATNLTRDREKNTSA